MDAITVKNISKKYGHRTILNSVNFSVKEKEFVAIVGPSGAGKSTLLNILGLLETPSSGSAFLFGKLIPKINSKKATMIRRNDVNYLFQSFALIDDMTVFQNLLLAMHFTDYHSRDKRKLIDQTVQELDLKQLENAKINTLSGGEQQRVALARIILKPGKLVFADEPTGALDEEHADEAFNQIEKLRSKYGKTIIMVTHNIEEAQKTDRIININDIQK
ncbi:ABC transporter ATP-binding protein [Philodulcilactobacillus myokoensis]|uniref:ABC transporter ATP-binding protein n=1 Tax=Philodulcilactobacillus myokoensis TaxID=2929573 RepID=A0A9W6B0B8_9LACO|nr:ABC transporter ATP-binding protein [Philodulcilactobacillus myokoensis]GLB46323.1 ABC transporter ATP-binding protein [Philodulcilactobacillus myokoensis]